MKNILLLTDFSANAKNAIDYAIRFFSGKRCNFFILNVQKATNYTTGNLMASSPTSSVYDSIIKNPKHELANIVKNLEKETQNEEFVFESICDYDSFISAINQTINNNKIDIIVMGTNGATGAREVLFGSNTIDVIRHTNCPVLVIPENHSYSELKKILFVSEDDEIFDEKSINVLDKILNNKNIDLDILTLSMHYHNDLSRKKEKIQHHFNILNLNFHSIIGITPDTALDSFTQTHPVDLIVKIINVDPFLKRLVSGSSTPNITYKSRIPLLLIHPT